MERPILFSTEMVRPIQKGLKTKTRRTNGLADINENPDMWTCEKAENQQAFFFFNKEEEDYMLEIKCPYGQVDDVLWVRETWTWEGDTKWTDAFPIGNFCYKADFENNEGPTKWKPSIHMPKSACRIKLRITDVRVERLHDITEEDAIAEGVDNWTWKNAATPQNWMDYRDPMSPPLLSAYDSFNSLWDSINGEQSWNDNPWVWVITFETINN